MSWMAVRRPSPGKRRRRAKSVISMLMPALSAKRRARSSAAPARAGPAWAGPARAEPVQAGRPQAGRGRARPIFTFIRMKGYSLPTLLPGLPMPRISLEFYPPKDENQYAQLDRTVARLKAHAPAFVSVTFGAGGSTLSYTPETV